MSSEVDPTKLDKKPHPFRTAQEAELAYENGIVELHDYAEYRRHGHEHFLTTVGRIIFNDRIERGPRRGPRGRVGPRVLRVRQPLAEEEGRQRDRLRPRRLGTARASVSLVLDAFKELGFHYASQAGDHGLQERRRLPPDKEEILERYESEVADIQQQYDDGYIGEEERKEAVTGKWKDATEEVAQAMENNLDELNPIFMMANSGARGSFKQIRQLAGMRGIMANPKGEEIERPIKANFIEGLSVLEYFISTHGARKGLADTALRTADSGYLTRRLVDVAQDVIVREEDCKTKDYIEMPLRDDDGALNDEPARPPGRARSSRPSAAASCSSETRRSTTPSSTSSPRHSRARRTSSSRSARRSSARPTSGICQQCYGRRDGDRHRWSRSATRSGIIAAQSIGEPGTQLTMRTFHTGGIAGQDITQGLPRVVELFEARKPKGLAQIAEVAGKVKVEEGEKAFKVYDPRRQGRGGRLQLPRRHRAAGRRTATRSKPAPSSTRARSTRPRSSRSAAAPTTELYLVARGPGRLPQAGRRHQRQAHRADRAADDEEGEGRLEGLDRAPARPARGPRRLQGRSTRRSRIRARRARPPAKASETILGITKASLATESFLSAASFQETTKVLTDAALEGKRDRLVGLKENVIIGKLIPAATGLKHYRTRADRAGRAGAGSGRGAARRGRARSRARSRRRRWRRRRARGLRPELRRGARGARDRDRVARRGPRLRRRRVRRRAREVLSPERQVAEGKARRLGGPFRWRSASLTVGNASASTRQDRLDGEKVRPTSNPRGARCLKEQ